MNSDPLARAKPAHHGVGRFVGETGDRECSGRAPISDCPPASPTGPEQRMGGAAEDDAEAASGGRQAFEQGLPAAARPESTTPRGCAPSARADAENLSTSSMITKNAGGIRPTVSATAGGHEGAQPSQELRPCPSDRRASGGAGSSTPPYRSRADWCSCESRYRSKPAAASAGACAEANSWWNQRGRRRPKARGAAAPLQRQRRFEPSQPGDGDPLARLGRADEPRYQSFAVEELAGGDEPAPDVEGIAAHRYLLDDVE